LEREVPKMRKINVIPQAIISKKGNAVYKGGEKNWGLHEGDGVEIDRGQ